MATQVKFEIAVDSKGAIQNITAVGGAADDLDKKQERAERSSKKLSGGFTNLASTANIVKAAIVGLAVGAIGKFLASATQAASRAEETSNLFRVSFGDMAMAAEEWAARTAQATGVNDTTLQQMSGTLFNMTSNMGLTREAAFSLSTGFTQLALDMSSFFNIPFEQALDKLRAGLSGEAEPLKQLGVLVTENSIKQTEFARNILSTRKELTESEKVQARAIVIMQGMQNAQNDLTRTQGSWANQTRLVGEAWVNLQERIGSFITESPVLLGLLDATKQFLNDISRSLDDNAEDWNNLLKNVLQEGVKILAEVSRGIAEAAKSLGDVGTVLRGLTVGSSQADIDKILGKETAEGAAEGFDRLASVFDNLSDRLSNLGSESAKTGEDLSTVGERTNDVETSTDNLSTTTKTYTDLLAALRGNMSDYSGATDEMTQAQERQQKEVERLAESLGVGGLKSDFDNLLAAYDMLTGAGDRLSQQGIERLVTAFDRASASGVLFDAQTVQLIATLRSAQGAASEASDEFDGMFDNVITTIPPAVAGVGDLGTKTGEAAILTDQLGSSVGVARDAMNLFGVESDNVFGRLLGYLSQGLSLFNSITGLLGKLGGGLGGLLGLGGSAAGAAAGGGAGGLGLGGLFGFLGGPVGIGIGAAAAGIGAIAAIFGGRGADDVQEEVRRDIGPAISDGLAEAILDAGKNAQLFLPEIFAEGNLGVDRLAVETAEIFSGVEQGLFSMGEAMSALDRTVPLLLSNFENLGSEGLEWVQVLLDTAAAAGVSSAALDELRAKAEGVPPLPTQPGAAGAPPAAPSTGGAGGGGAGGGAGGGVTVNVDVDFQIEPQGVIATDQELKGVIDGAVNLIAKGDNEFRRTISKQITDAVRQALAEGA